MRRRQVLAAMTAGGFAGCLGIRPPGVDSSAEKRERSTASGASEPASLAEQGFPSTICEEEINRDSIVAVVEPAFASDWSGAEIDDKYGASDLADEQVIVGLRRSGRARAYPLSVLWHHEVVNDSFGRPTLVTYCPICRSGLVAERVVAGRETVFGVSGLLWQAPAVRAAAKERSGDVFGAGAENESAPVRNSGNLVMFDEATRSYWSQMLATAICGPRTGEQLTILPSTVATWGEWRAENPMTDVCCHRHTRKRWRPRPSDSKTERDESNPGSFYYRGV